MLNDLPSGWRFRLFKEFCRFFKHLNGDNSEIEPLSVTKSAGIMLQSEKFNKRIATATANYKVLKRGEFAYDPMSLYYGAIGQLDCIAEGIVSPAYITFNIDETVDRQWFRHLIHSNLALRSFISKTEGGNLNGKRKKTDWSAFCSVCLPFPPLPEQRKIAEILSSVDEAIQATQAVIEQTRRVKEGLLQELLTKGVGHTRFKKTPIGEIPEEWELKHLGDVARIFNGKGAKSGGTRIRLFKTKHIYDGPVLTADPEYQPDDEVISHEWAFLQSGDVLTPNMAHSTIGRVAWLETVDKPALCDGQVMVIRSLDENVVRPRFLFDFLSASLGRKQLLAREVGSIFGKARGQTHLYPRDVETIMIPIPPMPEQIQLDAMRWLDTEIFEQTIWCEQLKRIKEGLRQDLLTGKVRVTI